MTALSRGERDARGRLVDVRREQAIRKRRRNRNLVERGEVIGDPASDRLYLVQELAAKGSVLAPMDVGGRRVRPFRTFVSSAGPAGPRGVRRAGEPSKGGVHREGRSQTCRMLRLVMGSATSP